MNPYSIQCPTCQTRLKVRSLDAIDQILACPRCHGMVLVTPPPPGSEIAEGGSNGNGSDSNIQALEIAEKPAAKPIAHDFDLVNDLFGGDDAPPVMSSRPEPPAAPPVAAEPPIAAAPPVAAAPIHSETAKSPAPTKPVAPKQDSPLAAKSTDKKASLLAPSAVIAPPASDTQKANAKAAGSGTKLPSLTSATVVVPADELAPPLLPGDSIQPVAKNPPAESSAKVAEPPRKPVEKPKGSTSSPASAEAKPAASAKSASSAAPSSTTSSPAKEGPPAATTAAPVALPPFWRDAMLYLGAGVLGILLAWGAMVVVLQFLAGGNEAPVASGDPPVSPTTNTEQKPEDKRPEEKAEGKPTEKKPVEHNPAEMKPAEIKPVDPTPPTPPVDPGPPVDPMAKPPVDPAPMPVDPVKPVDPAKPVDPPAEGPKPPEIGPSIPAAPERPKPPRVDVNARLAEKILEIEFPATPLEEFLDFLGSFTTIPISVDPEGLRLAGASLASPVTPKGASVDIRTLLDETLRPLGLGFQVAEGHVIVTARNLVREGAVPVPYPLVDLAGENSAELAALRELVVKFPLASIADPATREKAARLDKGVLTIESLMKEQFEVLLFLERLRLARGKKPVNPFVVRNPALVRLELAPPPSSESLDAVVRVNFARPVPFAQALAQLKKAAKARIMVDWRELEESAHIGPATEVPLVADNQPLRNALANLLTPLGLEFRVVEGGAIVISTVAGQQRSMDEPTIEFHKAGDLVAGGRPPEKLIERLTDSLEELGLKPTDASHLQYDPASGAIIARLPRRLQRPFADLLASWRGK